MVKITSQAQANAFRKELAKRRQAAQTRLFSKEPRDLSDADYNFLTSRCHSGQKDVFDDPARNIALLCPRRTGKSATMQFLTQKTSKIHPGSSIAYIVPSSKEHAKRLFWNPLRQMNYSLKLGIEFKVSEHRVITREGTSIYVFGAKNRESPALLRGDAWSLVILDECKDFGAHFEELIVEAVMPGLEDYDGQLVLAGTPGDVMQGLFYNITSAEKSPEGWSVHKWDKSINIFLPPEKRDLDQIEKREYWPFGLTKDSPKFRREQLAEWCTDESERAYQYMTDRNAWQPNDKGVYVLPEGHQWLHVLGLDLGEKDANAFIVWAFSLTCPDVYCVHEFAQTRMSIDAIAEKTNELRQMYSNMVTMVADTGGYGRGIVTDLQERHMLPFEAADKSGNKLGNIAQMNSDFLCGHIKIKDDGLLAAEYKRLTKRIRTTDGKVLISHSDLGDAALYGWKESKHYTSVEKPNIIMPGTDEYYIEMEKQAVEQAVKRRTVRTSGQWWGSPISRQNHQLY